MLIRFVFICFYFGSAMATSTKGKPLGAWPQKQTAIQTAFATVTMDIEETQDDQARKGFEDLSQSFDKGCSDESSKRAASASPVKEKLAELKRFRTGQVHQVGDGSAAGSMASDAPANPMRDLLQELSNKMDKMTVTMATKSDLEDMKTTMTAHTKVIVSEAVDPVKAELHDLKEELKDTQK